MTGSSLIAAIAPVIDALEALGVAYYVGGSLASSIHGIARASLDVDLVADLQPQDVRSFVERLEPAYYLDAERVRDAVGARRSFNLIHLETMFKVDVFLVKARPFDREALRRARPEPVEEGPEARRVRVAAPEDLILAKLEWFRSGGEVSERQWSDVVGVLKVTAAPLDRDHLERWAVELGVADLLEAALAEAEV